MAWRDRFRRVGLGADGRRPNARAAPRPKIRKDPWPPIPSSGSRYHGLTHAFIQNRTGDGDSTILLRTLRGYGMPAGAEAEWMRDEVRRCVEEGDYEIALALGEALYYMCLDVYGLERPSGRADCLLNLERARTALAAGLPAMARGFVHHRNGPGWDDPEVEAVLEEVARGLAAAGMRVPPGDGS